MISAKELMAKNANSEKDINDGVEIICTRIEKKLEDPYTKKVNIPERKVSFSYDEIFKGLKLTSTAYMPTLVKKLNELGYNFRESNSMCPNGAWMTLWHLTW